MPPRLEWHDLTVELGTRILHKLQGQLLISPRAHSRRIRPPPKPPKKGQESCLPRLYPSRAFPRPAGSPDI